MHNATILKKCSAVVVADLKAAFYRTVLEHVLGGLSDAASTEKLSRKLALSPQLALQLRAPAAQGTVLRTWSSRMPAQNQVILWPI